MADNVYSFTSAPERPGGFGRVDISDDGSGIDTFVDSRPIVLIDLAFGGDETVTRIYGAMNPGESMPWFVWSFGIFNGPLENVTLNSQYYEATVTGNASDNILIGYSGSAAAGYACKDEFYGNAGNDTIYGGRGNDIIDGGSGIDALSGGDGDDTIYFDAADNAVNILGGAGFDTLIIDSGENAAGFDLAQQGFELARVNYVDDSGANWTDAQVYFAAGWQRYAQITNYDDGRSTNEIWDYNSTQSWASYTEYVSVAEDNRLEARHTIYDDGRTEAQHFDFTNTNYWSSYTDYFHSSGQREASRIINDDGAFQTTYFDSAGSSWYSYTDYNRTDGNLTARLQVNDDGSRSTTYYDVDHLNNWSQYTDYYDPSYNFIGRAGLYDDGTLF